MTYLSLFFPFATNCRWKMNLSGQEEWKNTKDKWKNNEIDSIFVSPKLLPAMLQLIKELSSILIALIIIQGGSPSLLFSFHCHLFITTTPPLFLSAIKGVRDWREEKSPSPSPSLFIFHFCAALHFICDNFKTYLNLPSNNNELISLKTNLFWGRGGIFQRAQLVWYEAIVGLIFFNFKFGFPSFFFISAAPRCDSARRRGA